jgi:formylglycine-generating enzyme required for sulfatase activity
MTKYFLFVLMLGVSAAIAETPSVIYPKTKEIRSSDWYANQSKLWKLKATSANSSSSDWLNYFLAARYAQQSSRDLEEIVNTMGVKYPGSFEYHLAAAMNGGYDAAAFTHLKAAHALRPAEPMAFGLLVLMNEFESDVRRRKEYSQQLLNSGLVSPSLLNYSYNVLMSLERDAILFTDSENTALPLFLLQDVMNVREDVAVLNLDLLVEDQYRDNKLQALNLKYDNLSTTRPALCTTLPEQNGNRVFYYALTLSKENILAVKDQLYVVGLASQLSSSRIDNIHQIRTNMENRFLMDYLTVDFNGESEYAAGKALHANYLVPMLLLLEHYKANKEDEKAAMLQEEIVSLARKSGKLLLVENFLSGRNTEAVPFVPYKLDNKAMEGSLKLVKDNVYAHEYEVTNQQYNDFLLYLKENNRADVYETARHKLDKYTEPALSFMTGYHSNRQPTKKEKYFLNYPVVNITYEGALAYCEWLTEQYNNAPERKYKKVRFRLPSIDEWQIAAAGVEKATSWKLNENTAEVKIPAEGKEYTRNAPTKVVSLSDPEILYPWYVSWNFRNRPLNSKGCSLGNFKYPETQQPCVRSKMNTADGFLLMSPVQAYFSNKIGLYDVVGNVAEMTSEKGKACGGSWNHPPEESTIRSINMYNDSSSDTGFRLFMEVIEQ